MDRSFLLREFNREYHLDTAASFVFFPLIKVDAFHGESNRFFRRK